MARKRPTQGSARSKQRSKAGLRDLDARKGGSVKGGFLGGLIKKAGGAVGPFVTSPPPPQ